MTMMTIIGLTAGWIVCGLLAYVLTLSSLTNAHPTVDHRAFAALMGCAGPFGLAVVYGHSDRSDGLMVWGILRDWWIRARRVCQCRGYHDDELLVVASWMGVRCTRCGRVTDGIVLTPAYRVRFRGRRTTEQLDRFKDQLERIWESHQLQSLRDTSRPGGVRRAAAVLQIRRGA